MRARLLVASCAALLLTGCAGTPGADQQAASPSTTAPRTIPAMAAAPECEQLPDRSASPGSDTLPGLALACLGPGPDMSLDHLTGRPTLVNLWATWCGPCREEMPLLQDAHTRAGEQIRFLGVDTQDDPAGAASFIQDLGVDYPQVVDPDGRLLATLGVRGLPVTLAIDASGQGVGRSVGQLDPEKLQGLIDRLLS